MRDMENKKFGEHLRSLRRKSKETLADVSGAVEIDVNTLGDIEAGNKLPSEDIVLLLISHFSLREDEALKLWQLAGFDKGTVSENQQENLPFISEDNRILYTDMVHVSANNYGVIINFLQGLGNDGKPSAVARVGMSREHARSIIDVLTRTLALAEQQKQEPKQLGDGKK